jgi:hypothetical protein
MQKILFAVAFVALFSLSSCDKFNKNIAPPNQSLAFFKYYGHVYDQKAADIARTSDGGYIILGSTNSFVSEVDRGNFYNYYLIRTDSLGNEIWSKSYGTAQYDNIAKRIIVLPDDEGFVIAGNRQRINFSTGQGIRAQKRINLIKIDVEGAIISEHVLPNGNETNSFDYELYDIKRLPEGDYALTGSTTNVNTTKPAFNATTDKLDVYIARLNGATLSPAFPGWDAIYGFQGNDWGVSIHGVSGAFIVAGTTQTYNTGGTFIYEYLVVKYSPAFSAILTQRADGDVGKNLIAADATYDSISGVLTIIGNEQLSFAIGDDRPGQLALMQYNIPNARNNVLSRSSATMPSIYTNGSAEKAGLGSRAVSIKQLTDGSFIATSTSTRIEGLNTDVHVIKFTSQLQVQWDWLFGTGATLDQAGRAIMVREVLPDTPEDPLGAVLGYAVAGTFDFTASNNVIGVVKTNDQGSIVITGQ